VFDIDLEKFFDRDNRDKLMDRLAQRITFTLFAFGISVAPPDIS